MHVTGIVLRMWPGNMVVRGYGTVLASSEKGNKRKISSFSDHQDLKDCNMSYFFFVSYIQPVSN